MSESFVIGNRVSIDNDNKREVSMDWQTVVIILVILGAFFLLATKGCCCGMKGKDSAAQDEKKQK